MITDAEKKAIQQETRRETLNACAMIAALEAHYWAEVDDPRIQEMATGAMGAASNICSAIALGVTVAQFRADIATRDLPPEDATGMPAAVDGNGHV